MSQHVTIQTDVLIFTDEHFVAGGITSGDQDITLLTQGTTLVLRDLFFPEPKSEAEQKLGSPAAAIAAQFPGLTENDASDAINHFLTTVPNLIAVDRPPSFGPIEVENNSLDGRLDLGSDRSTYLPAGRLFKRHVDDYTIHFCVSAKSLIGVMRPDPSLAAVTANPNKIEMVPGPGYGGGYVPPFTPPARGGGHGGGHGGKCGVCGTCGLCALCGEINSSAAAASAAAVASVFSVALELREAHTRNPQSATPVRSLEPPAGVPPLARIAEIKEAVIPLQRLAENLSRRESGTS